MPSSTHHSYTKPAVALHWLVAFFIFINFPLGLYMDTYPHNSTGFNEVLFYHASIGTLILLLVVLRWMWRITHVPPALPSTVAKWQVMSSHGLHWLLYVLMLAVPLTGYVHRLAGGHPVNFFGLGDLPVFLGRNESLRLLTDTLHRSFVFVLAFLVVGHLAAALKHRFVDRDGVAERMGI
jgi:cytochrome b561